MKQMLFTIIHVVIISSAPAKEFNVADFGAAGDTKTICTNAIQKTIDAAHQAGGGTVTFKKGVFLTGAIFLKSNVHLRIDKGVEIRAVQLDSAYPMKWIRVAGIEKKAPAALINVHNQKNVIISGNGLINGNGDYWWEKFWGKDRKGGMLKEYNEKGLRWAVDYDCLRPELILIYKSRDVKLQGLTLKRSPFWTVHICYSSRIIVDGITIRENTGPSTDGVNVDSSSNVLIQNCDIDCNDDCLCLKAGRDADGLRVNRPTKNVTIRDCITRRGHGMLTIGSETAGGIRNVEVYNIIAKSTNVGIRAKSARIRGGTIENICIHDIVMQSVPVAFRFDLNWMPEFSYPQLPEKYDKNNIPPHWKVLLEKVTPPEKGYPTFRDITVKNLRAYKSRIAFIFEGLPEKPVRKVHLENVSITARTAGNIKNTRDWSTKNVSIKTLDGKPLETQNTSNLNLPKVKKISSQPAR